MSAIIDGIKSIVDFITNLVTFVIDLISNTIEFIGMIPDCVDNLSNAIQCLPGILTVFATVSITVSVILMMIGRGRVN